jgi:glycosyltransferase involved in cell wall biosynthesis
LKILVLCDRYPFPLTNGQNLRIFNYVRLLKARHHFDLVCYADVPAPPEVRGLFGQVQRFERPVPVRSSGMRRIVDAFDVEQFIPRSEAVRQALTQRLAGGHYDLVWVSGWDMIVNLPADQGVPVLADAVDDGVLEWWSKFRQSRGLVERSRMLKRVLMNARFERRYFGAAQGVLFVSELDAGVFRRIAPNSPTHVVHNGVDTDYFRPLGMAKHPDALVFEGNMGFAPNVEAALYLVREVLPLIRRRRPVKLALVGIRPAPEVQALAGEDVEVTGFVEDVRPYVDRAAVFLCPMLSGAGIKNKILQAWAMGVPVVGTRAATGGLAVREGDNMLLGDSPQALAAAVVRVLDDPALAKRLGEEGRRTAVERYTWAAKAAELEAVFERVAVAQRPLLAH